MLSHLPLVAAGVTLYGSVNAPDVVEALRTSVLAKLGVTEKGVRFAGDERVLKTVGAHPVEIEARPGLWCTFTLTIESS